MSRDDAERSQAEQFRAEQQLLHALLQGLHEDNTVREDRIAATMRRYEVSQVEEGQQIEEAPQILIETKPRSQKASQPAGYGTSKKPRRSLRWLATVVAVMIAGFFWNQFLQPAQLDAAVDRVEQAAIKPVTRVYDIRFHAESRGGGDFSKLGRLHTKSTDQFVVSMDERSKRPMIFGVDGQVEWFIVGHRYGTLNEQANGRPQAPFLEERMHRFMLTNRLLESLSDNYAVELLNVTPPRGLDKRCTGLLGKQIDYDRKSPQEVRIWADHQTGVALRVSLTWSHPLRFKPHRVLLEFVGEKTVGENFYKLDHHVSALGLDVQSDNFQ